jgi:hypothetical protein
MIVWGGWGDEVGHVKLADGAAYDPAKARWRQVAPAPLAPRRNHAAAWTGSEMLIVGGDGRRDGAAYNPVADSWRPLPPAPFAVGSSENLEGEGRAVTGDALYIWSVGQDRVARFDFARGRWDERPGPGFGAVHAGALRVVGDHLVAVATTSVTGASLRLATSDLAVSSWTRRADGEFPHDRFVSDVDPNWSAAAGDELIAWSESRPDAVVGFNVSSGTWRSRSPHALAPCVGAPPPQEVDGGFVASSCGTTVRYDSSTDTWRRLDVGELTVNGRESVWTGDRLISWGQTCCYGTGGAPFKSNVAWISTPAP